MELRQLGARFLHNFQDNSRNINGYLQRYVLNCPTCLTDSQPAYCTRLEALSEPF